jgi:hypothetical protein
MTSSASTTPGRLTEYGGSPWDESMLEHFLGHVEGERDLLEAYAKFREEGPEHVRYLIDIILIDEARHHQMFQELVNRVRSDIDWRNYEPKVPFITRDATRAPELVEATDRLIAFERKDQQALHRLQKELRPMRDTNLFSLLVELMEFDTKKHIAILEFIRRRATET